MWGLVVWECVGVSGGLDGGLMFVCMWVGCGLDVGWMWGWRRVAWGLDGGWLLYGSEAARWFVAGLLGCPCDAYQSLAMCFIPFGLSAPADSLVVSRSSVCVCHRCLHSAFATILR